MNEAADLDRRARWIDTVRRMHRWKRLGGYLGCVLGACLMLWGRFSPEEAPDWAFAAGLAIIVFSWLLFIFVLVDKWRWVKAHPYDASDPG
jgi:hypothetical protein